jgi:GPH family glycoside/pentoside/hexuronide:cation symporter
MLTVTAAYMLADTLQSLVIVPYLALTPELTPDYDERTSITSYRMFFNLVASLLAAAVAPAVLDAVVSGGGSQQQGYLLVAALFGGLAMVPFLLMFAFLREPPAPPLQQAERREPVRAVFHALWRNVPFRYATALNMLTWVSLDLIGLILPFFLTYWIAQGNLLAQADLFGMSLGLETAVLGVLFILAILCLPFWAWLARRIGKQRAFIAGAAYWAVVQIVMVLLQPGEVAWVLRLAALAGIGLSMAQVLPDAIFPDVVEWDELHTRRRREGAYYGAKNFARKLTGALAIFIALQALGWFGYQSPTEGALQFQQPASALAALRVLTGPVGALLLVAAIVVAWFYPITRERHVRIRRLLAQRQRLTAR